MSTHAIPEATSVTVTEEAVEGIEEKVAGAEKGGEEERQPPPAPERKRRPNRIFVGHGKNKTPRDQLTKMLGQLNIPFKVAEDEPNLGRPISQKVRQTMDECGAGILIFTADREYRDLDGGAIWLSSENVANELGAAAVMYDDRIIIFKQEGVELASNYSGVGYITFEKDQLEAKMPDLLRELVAMKILKGVARRRVGPTPPGAGRLHPEVQLGALALGDTISRKPTRPVRGCNSGGGEPTESSPGFRCARLLTTHGGGRVAISSCDSR